jgi:subtilisin family serine protease
LEARDSVHADALLRHLSQEPLVAHVYLQPRLFAASAGATGLPPVTMSGGGDISPPTPSWVSQQYAHDPSPLGHGVRMAAGVLGARGQGIGFRMIENGWVLGHEDLCQMVASNVLGPVPSVATTEALHGTSGGSIVFADRNAYGITGIADEVSAKFIGININGGYANAISIALSNSQPGDVAMVVIMVLVPALGPGTWLPFEFFQSSFDATLTATANGLHVVVPAGNGNRSLDDPALLGRFDRYFRDSGAIIVGASEAGLMHKAPFSNWGSRIDAHSWGDQVIACGYGTLFYPNNDPLQAYTASGTGTSSATPHIAAVVAAMQGASLRQNGQLLSNAQVLDLLHTVGATTPDVIGRRPDLFAILQQLQAVDGLTMVAPEVALGDTIQADISGPAGSIAAMFGSFATGNVPIGFNRNIHLDLGSYAVLGAFALSGGSAQYQLPVPNNVALHGSDIYFQAVRLTGAQQLFVTNSCQVTIL